MYYKNSIVKEIEFLNNHKDEPETIKTLAIMKRKGRKPDGTAHKIFLLANDLQTRLIKEKKMPLPTLTYPTIDRHTEIQRWDKKTQKGLE